MLKFVVDGYYKTMSSLMYKAIRNTGELVLYEPLCIYKTQQSKQSKQNPYSPLHGIIIDCWQDERIKSYYSTYKQIHKRCWERMQKSDIPMKMEEVREFFDFIHALPFQCSVQTNNCHFLLDKIAKDYNAKIIFLLRNPVDIWLYHILDCPVDLWGYIKKWKDKRSFRFIVAKLLNKYKNTLAKSLVRWVLLNFIPRYKNNINPYAVVTRYKRIKQHFPTPEPSDILDIFLIAYTYSNYYGYINAKKANGLVVYYEDLIKNPMEVWRSLQDFGIPVDKTIFNKTSPKYSYRDEKAYEEIIERVRQLNLYKMFKKFYPEVISW